MPNNNPQSPPQPSGRTATSSKISERLEQTADQTAKLADRLGQSAEEQASAAVQRLQDVGQQARAGLEQQRAQVAERVRRLGDALRSSSVSLQRDDELAANVLSAASRRLDSVAIYIDELTPRAVADDVQTLARSRPGLFFGAAFLVGLGLGRFAKSSSGAGAEVQRASSAARRGAWGDAPRSEQSERSNESESSGGVERREVERREGKKS